MGGGGEILATVGRKRNSEEVETSREERTQEDTPPVSLLFLLRHARKRVSRLTHLAAPVVITGQECVCETESLCNPPLHPPPVALQTFQLSAAMCVCDGGCLAVKVH